jgi:hypothetical protein
LLFRSLQRIISVHENALRTVFKEVLLQKPEALASCNRQACPGLVKFLIDAASVPKLCMQLVDDHNLLAKRPVGHCTSERHGSFEVRGTKYIFSAETCIADVGGSLRQCLPTLMFKLSSTKSLVPM